MTHNGTVYCEWNYNGLGIDYQVLAGPAYMAVFTVVGVILGIVADKYEYLYFVFYGVFPDVIMRVFSRRYNRVRVLAGCTLVFSIAIILMGSVKEYWHLVVLRMIMAAG